MGEAKQIKIKNETYYFSNDEVNLKDFDARLLKIDKKDYIEIEIYCIGYVTTKKNANCNNINSVNPLNLMINEMIGHFVEKNEKMMWMKTKKFQKNMKKFGKVLKQKLKRLIVAKKVEYRIDLKKIRFESNDDLPLNKPIKLPLLTIIIRYVFSEDGKFYPQLFLDNAIYEL